MLAVMNRSESDLRQAIVMSPHELNDCDATGWTALHLSVRWPTGALILIEAGADVDFVGYSGGMSFLDLVLEAGSVELLRILGEADYSFVEESNSSQWDCLRNIGCYCRESAPNNPRRILCELSAEKMMMAQLLVNFIAKRRQRLCDLAFEKVPGSVLAPLLPMKADEPYIVDEKASELVLELTSRGITVPLPLNPGEKGQTGYHAIGGRPELAEILWKAGFRDVNGRDSFNMTPLSYCHLEYLLRFIGWCSGKGFVLNLDVEQDRAWYGGNADKLDEFRPGQTLATKSIYGKLVELGGRKELYTSPRRIFVDYLVSSEADRRIAQKIFAANSTDGCKCACSTSGCTTRTFLFKGFDYVRGRSASSVLTTCDLMELYSDLKDVCNTLDAAEYLRLITFEKLELTHTCCRPRLASFSEHPLIYHWGLRVAPNRVFRLSRAMGRSEIEEIRDEEAADLQKLAELLAEFEAKVVELDLSIPDFISRYWEPRMEQVLRENEGSLDMEALREMGVKVYSHGETADLEGGHSHTWRQAFVWTLHLLSNSDHARDLYARARFNTPHKIHPIPTPTSLGPHDLLLKTAVASLCHTDSMVTAGRMGTPLACTASHEGTGTVITTGASVPTHDFAPGDRVMAGLPRSRCGQCADCRGPDKLKHYCANVKGYVGVTLDGAFAEYMVVDARESSRIPDGVAWETAAPLACAGVTVWGGLMRADLKVGETVALVGAGGGLGHLGCRFAKALGLRVVGIEAREEGLQLAKECGADVVVDARRGDEAVVEEVQRVTEGRGADATLNLSDAETAAGVACKVTKMHGLMVQIAQPPSVSIPMEQFIFRDIRVHGSLLASRTDAQRMLDLVAAEKISVKTNPFFGLRQVPDLIALAQSGRMAGKGVLVVDEREEAGVRGRLGIGS
ncbi:MAG: hypothetical protein Q9195_007208 [Heterodermia aff. obscurata]